MYAILTEKGEIEIKRFDTQKEATDYQAGMFRDGITTVVRPVDFAKGKDAETQPEKGKREPMKIRTNAFCAVRETPGGKDVWLDLGTISVHDSAVRSKADEMKPAFNKDYPVSAIIAVTVEGEMP